MAEQLRCPACYQTVMVPPGSTTMPEHMMGPKPCWGTGQSGWPAAFPMTRAPQGPMPGSTPKMTGVAPSPHPLDAEPAARRPTPTTTSRSAQRSKDTGLQLAKWLAAVGALMAITALFSWPIEYYTALRYVVTLAAIVVAFVGSSVVLTAWRDALAPDTHEDEPVGRDRLILWWAAGLPGLLAIAAIFNPVFPSYLGSRQPWRPIDMVTALVLGVAAVVIPQERAGDNQEGRKAVNAFILLAGWVLGAALFLGAILINRGDGYQGRPDCDTSYSVEPGC